MKKKKENENTKETRVKTKEIRQNSPTSVASLFSTNVASSYMSFSFILDFLETISLKEHICTRIGDFNFDSERT